MEVQISPAPLFNGSNQNMIRASASSQSYEPSSKRFKSDLTFQCIVCSDVYDDPNILYEHMKVKHQELYEGEDGENGFESDSEHELSDEEYLDLSRLLEPICELKQVDEDNVSDHDNHYESPAPASSLQQPSNVIAQLMQNNLLGMPMNEDQLRLQIQLQMQLQHHLLQLQANNEKQKPKQNINQKLNNRAAEKPLSLRKLNILYSDSLGKLIEFVFDCSSRSRSRSPTRIANIKWSSTARVLFVSMHSMRQFIHIRWRFGKTRSIAYTEQTIPMLDLSKVLYTHRFAKHTYSHS